LSSRGNRGTTLNPQPSTLNPQPSTLNPQPSTLNPQPCCGRARRPPPFILAMSPTVDFRSPKCRTLILTECDIQLLGVLRVFCHLRHQPRGVGVQGAPPSPSRPAAHRVDTQVSFPAPLHKRQGLGCGHTGFGHTGFVHPAALQNRVWGISSSLSVCLGCPIWWSQASCRSNVDKFVPRT
jgi:hypothetical protein